MIENTTSLWNPAHRRRFIGQFAAGSAAWLSGMFAFVPKASAHNERMTMVAATLGKDWNIANYRLRRHGRQTALESFVVTLLDERGTTLGEFVRTRKYRITVENGYDADGNSYEWPKRYVDHEHLQLAWAAETLDVDTSQAEGRIRVKYNGQPVGTARPKDAQWDASLLAIASVRGELFRIASSVSIDLDRAYPEPQRPIHECCCQTGCVGDNTSGGSYNFYRSVACYDAETNCGNNCNNSFCWGCCIYYGCDCACAPGTDFYCYCIVSGRKCGCSQYCV